MGMASSSSFVSCRFCKLERMLGSMTKENYTRLKRTDRKLNNPKKKGLGWNNCILKREEKTPTRERKYLWYDNSCSCSH